MQNQTNEKPQKSGWAAFFRTIGRLRLPWIWIIVGLAVNLASNQLLLDLPDTTANLLGDELSGPALVNAVMFYVVFGLMSCVAVVGQVQAQSYGVKCARTSVWKKMLSLRMDFFDRNDPSDLMSTIINDASAAVNDFINVLLNLIPDIYYVVMALTKITRYHFILGISCFALLPLKYIYAFVMGRQMQKGTARVYGRIGTLTSFLSDRINNLPLIKTYTNEDKESKSGEEAAHRLMKANMKLVHLDNISTAAMAVLDILQKFVVVVIAVVLLQKGEIDMATWIAFFLFAQNLFPTVDEIFDMWVKIKGMYGSFERMIGIMSGASEDTREASAFPESGDIRFENVTFSYPDTDRPALDNVSFEVKRGSAVAVVGLCGSGKTTSVSLLERFYAPDSGRITVGGTDISEFSLADFRSHMSYVQQGAEIFSGTLREALTYGIEREISDDEIRAAAARTGFDEYLKLCENGLDTDIASGGGSMSGGQSQRLVLTREVLRDGDIVLMDEPTSALDVRVSAKIQETMDAVFAEKTRILITHDLSLARRYDRIIVMDSGKLVGDGTHDELLAGCSTYKTMNENAQKEATV